MSKINWRISLAIGSVALAFVVSFGGQCGGTAATPTTAPQPTQAPQEATATSTVEEPTAAPTTVPGATTPPGGEVPAPYAGMKNPYGLNDSDAIDAGEAIYKSNCQGCHGENGDGKGSIAGGLNPPPADFTKLGPRFAEQADREFWILSEGFPGSAMPAFKSRLTEEQRWQVLTYEWTFAK